MRVRREPDHRFHGKQISLDDGDRSGDLQPGNVTKLDRLTFDRAGKPVMSLCPSAGCHAELWNGSAFTVST